jgi:hypothetical protein
MPIAISENFFSISFAKTANPKQTNIKIIGEDVLKKETILFIYVKFDLLAVIYGIAFLFIGVCLRKLVVNGDFICKYYLFFWCICIAIFIGVYLTIVFVFHRSSMTRELARTGEAFSIAFANSCLWRFHI